MRFELQPECDDLSPGNIAAINESIDGYLVEGMVDTLAEATLVNVLDDFIISLGTTRGVCVDELRMIIHGNIKALRARSTQESKQGQADG